MRLKFPPPPPNRQQLLPHFVSVIPSRGIFNKIPTNRFAKKKKILPHFPPPNPPLLHEWSFKKSQARFFLLGFRFGGGGESWKNESKKCERSQTGSASDKKIASVKEKNNFPWSL